MENTANKPRATVTDAECMERELQAYIAGGETVLDGARQINGNENLRGPSKETIISEFQLYHELASFLRSGLAGTKRYKMFREGALTNGPIDDEITHIRAFMKLKAKEDAEAAAIREKRKADEKANTPPTPPTPPAAPQAPAQPPAAPAGRPSQR